MGDGFAIILNRLTHQFPKWQHFAGRQAMTILHLLDDGQSGYGKFNRGSNSSPTPLLALGRIWWWFFLPLFIRRAERCPLPYPLWLTYSVYVC